MQLIFLKLILIRMQLMLLILIRMQLMLLKLIQISMQLTLRVTELGDYQISPLVMTVQMITYHHEEGERLRGKRMTLRDVYCVLLIILIGNIYFPFLIDMLKSLEVWLHPVL
ncbi:hypothetical protein DsansV1_C22g0172241 [Dioscorea sansibarensis]